MYGHNSPQVSGAQVREGLGGGAEAPLRQAELPLREGEALHEATVLNYSEQGRTRAVMLPAEAVGPVREAVQAYRAARLALEGEANAGLAKVVEAWGAKR